MKVEECQQHLSNNLKLLRAATSLTQREVGLKINATRATISYYENFHMLPSIGTVCALGEAFGLENPFDIFTRDLAAEEFIFGSTETQN